MIAGHNASFGPSSEANRGFSRLFWGDTEASDCARISRGCSFPAPFISSLQPSDFILSPLFKEVARTSVFEVRGLSGLSGAGVPARASFIHSI